ncbi:hypothetical protein DL771_007876 [Monosporascus sp. 5C6A]|nr:hypothetical protein DL771_007876 [Monosporascus sp. 5C6A]
MRVHRWRSPQPTSALGSATSRPSDQALPENALPVYLLHFLKSPRNIRIAIAMEAVGLGVGIAGLAGILSSVREAKETFDSYRYSELESRPFVTQRDASRLLLQQWSESVGYEAVRLKDDHHEALDDPRVRDVVDQIVQCISDIDADAENKPPDTLLSSGTHGTRSQGPRVGSNGQVQLDRYRKPMSRKNKFTWATRDKRKASEQTQHAAALLQTLRELVPPPESHGASHAQKGSEAQDVETVSSLLQQLKRALEDALEEAQEMDRRRRNDNFKRELPRWLGTTWTTAMYDNFVQRRLEGTCEWIIQRPEFLDWANEDSPNAKVLWIHGPAGYGKTILCAKVIEHLQSRSPPFAYHFFSSESDSRADPFVIIRSWTYQMILQSQQAFELARERWEASEGCPASPTNIREIFKAIVQIMPSCIFVVDGLDECAGTGHDWKSSYRESLVEFFTFLKQAASTESRIVVVSRDEQEIKEGFHTGEAGTQWDLYDCPIRPDDVKDDATRFARSVANQKLRSRSQSQRDELSQRMVDRFESMFLCIRILEGQLSSWKSQAQLHRIIDQAPTGLNDLYDRNWRRIADLPEPDRSRALAILRWTTFALRPMTVLEITEALPLADEGCDVLSEEERPDVIDEEYIRSGILDLCGSLVEVRGPASDPPSLTIHLTHFSVRQYVLCHVLVPAGHIIVNERLRSSNEAAQSNILAITCLRYLSFDQVREEARPRDATGMGEGFREYATTSWYQHVKRDADNSQQMIECVNSFFHLQNKNWEPWRKHAEAALQDEILHYQGRIQSGSPLFYASLLGFSETIAYLTERLGLDVNHVDSSSRTALLAASSKGWVSGVTDLLERGASINMASSEGRTPLYVAATNGHIKTVNHLLEKGADLTAADNNGWTPLNVASWQGHLKVVKLLLERGADLTVADNHGWTPLNVASCQGHLEVVKLLIGMRADLTVADNDGLTPLNSASFQGHLEVVKLLLEMGANLTVADKDGSTPLN